MAIDKELLKGSTSLLVLKLLNNEEMYGYQIIKELKLKSEDVFELKEGTLYPILHSLESSGIIEAYWEQSESARKRKYYKITTKGKKFLKEKEHEWNTYASAVKKVLGGGALSEQGCF